VIAVDAAELLDLSDPDVVADPYPAFAALRAEAPVAWHSGLGIWVATSHAACSQVLRERALGRIFRPREPDHEWETFNWLHADSILDSEPPKHTRLRRLVQSAFSRGHVSRLGPRIEELTAGLLDDCAAHLAAYGSFDVIADLTKEISLAPADAEAYDRRGLAYAHKTLYDQAIADHTRAIEINAKDILLHPGFVSRYAGAYGHRGDAYELKGVIDAAIADYRAALKLDPGLTSAKDALKRLGAAP